MYLLSTYFVFYLGIYVLHKYTFVIESLVPIILGLRFGSLYEFHILQFLLGPFCIFYSILYVSVMEVISHIYTFYLMLS